jgi:hypothetical protein
MIKILKRNWHLYLLTYPVSFSYIYAGWKEAPIHVHGITTVVLGTLLNILSILIQHKWETR